MGCSPSINQIGPIPKARVVHSRGASATLFSIPSRFLSDNDSMSPIPKVPENNANCHPEFELPFEQDWEQLDRKDEELVLRITNSIKPDCLFTDEEFPASNSSLYFNDRDEDEGTEWKRPHELISEPVLLLDGCSREDIIQGVLGDCWFLSSCAAVVQRQDLMNKIIPHNQPLFGPNYKGIVRFHFWRFGSWITVYIDDRLPTKLGQLIYARCSDEQEFWVALLEKAYAKLHTSYEALEGGQAMDALVDLTAGLAERYDLDDDKINLYRYMNQSLLSGAFITCSRKGDWRRSQITDVNGLVSGHAYTVTAVNKIKTKEKTKVRLLRIRNPWGNDAEWKGKWADNSEAWDQVPEDTKKEIGYENSPDGVFWMSFEDFRVHFEEVSMCTLGPDYERDGKVDYNGQVKAIRGAWELNRSCGGSRNNLASFITNPQYLLTLHGNNNSLKMCNVLIALMQEQKRYELKQGKKMFQIGFVIYKAVDKMERLSLEYFLFNQEVGSSGTYVNFREVFGRFELPVGNYIVIPATFEPDCPSNFMIRVYSDHFFNIKMLPDWPA